MLLAGLVGILMVLLGPWEFSDGWISVAFVLWFAALGNALLLLGPASRRLARAGQSDAGVAALQKRVAMFTGIGHLLFLALVIVMVWGPANP
jgi:hypothetical protein